MNEIRTDVFISFKNSDFSGNRTKDSEIAQNLYDELTARGISAFYSNASLMSLGQSVYKRAIDEALECAKVLIIVSSCPEFLNSEWVKYEWESFHSDILSGMKKNSQIIPYLGDISRENTPRSLRDFQTFSINSHSVSVVADFAANALAAANGTATTSHGAASSTIDRASLHDGGVKKIRKSLYTSDGDREYDRLMVQSKNTHACDMAVLNKLISKIDKGGKPLWILDLGCAYNFVGNMRFGKMENVRVLGIDISDKCLDYAQKTSDPEKFVFRKIDLEDMFFEETMRDTMIELGIESFDIMFGALLLLHLKKPVTVLKRLRKFLSHDGYMILRGSDDGSVLAVNDDGLIKKIVDKCNTTVGFSDRQNGRKLYNQLVSAGYIDVKVETFIKDRSGKDIDERDEIFFERFSYRINNFNKILKADPNNESKRNDFLFMKYALEELEEMFSNQDFWYCEHDFIAYGRAK